VFSIELTGHNLCLIIFPISSKDCGQAEFPMFPKEEKRWLTLYKAALLELDLQKMPKRIVLASEALQQRSRQLRGSGNHYGEKLEIEYAIRNLHVAERMK
jgi:hypothetical protein